ncbi:MAG: hypothetical protein C0490_14275 [Marivirga sp.]|nr:hypothetical protein [Marivirga sp.]
MKLFRIKYVSNALSLFTGIVFLNMSFFLAEVSLLKLDQDKQMVENIAKLLAGCAAEEEKDVFGGSADEDPTAKEIDLIFSYAIFTPDGFIQINKSKVHALDQGIPRLGNYEIYSPPPEA